ncbi:MAG: MFS transporter [Armatimonadetes bacterium]|nr:MFS transporter [Armatimonadota bacterium]MDW8121347.1 MFS transporter [Armatimonadota bacterium]
MKVAVAWKWACVLALIVDFGGGLTSVSVPVLAVHLGASPTQVGFIGAVGSACYTFFCLTSYLWTDRWGRRNSIFLGSILVTLACLILAGVSLQSYLLPLALMNCFLGVSYAFFWPATQATAGVGVPPSQLISVLRWYNLAWSGGRMVGTGIAGFLFLQHPALPFLTAALASGLAAFLATNPVTDQPTKQKLVDASHSSFSGASVSPLLVTSGQLGNLIRAVSVMGITVLFPKLAKTWGWAEHLVSGLLFWIFLGHTAGFFLAPYLIRNVGWSWVQGCKLVIAIMTALVGFLTSPFFLTGIFFVIGLFASWATTLSLYLSISSQGKSVRGSARHEASVGAGAAGGPIIGGFLMEQFSPQVAFFLPYLLTVFLFLWDGYWLRKEERLPSLSR